MRVERWIVASIVSLFVGTSIAAQERGQRGGAPAAGPAMTLTIAAFPDGGQVPVKFSQAADGAAPGEGTSPAMTWSNAPAGTQSFVLNMHDMDVARNKTTDDQAHWVVWNIPATATGLGRRRQGSQLPDGSYQIARPDRSIADLAHPRPVLSITTCSSSSRSTPRSASSRRRMPSRRAPKSCRRYRDILGKAVYGGLFKRPVVSARNAPIA